MSFFEKKYEFLGWDENIYSMTARNLYERVVKDSQSDYNWIAPATELVRVCNEPRFPEVYARVIKLLILNCFANLELKRSYPTREGETDQAVNHCYNSLPNINEEVISVKTKYLSHVITAITNPMNNRWITVHQGVEYDQMCSEWRKAKFDEYVSIEEVDFNQLRENLYADFEKTIKEKGLLDEKDLGDDEHEKYEVNFEQLRDWISSLKRESYVPKRDILLK